MDTKTAGAIRSPCGFDLSPPTPAQRRDLEAALTPEERDVFLEHGTEAPFCGVLLDNKSPGAYCCKLCGLPLFKSGAKFESGTGWPSLIPSPSGDVQDARGSAEAQDARERSRGYG